jgi:hypothetical protein
MPDVIFSARCPLSVAPVRVDGVIRELGPERLVAEQADVADKVELAVGRADERIARMQVCTDDSIVNVVLVDVVGLDIRKQVKPHRSLGSGIPVHAAESGCIGKPLVRVVIIVNCDCAQT